MFLYIFIYFERIRIHKILDKISNRENYVNQMTTEILIHNYRSDGLLGETLNVNIPKPQLLFFLLEKFEHIFPETF